MNDLISVIIPAYNREKTIVRSINSVINQTYKNIEIIIVDDCSTDNTFQIASSFQDYRIRVIRLERNSGAQTARNKGIEIANGKWIAFLDSDDVWEPNKLELQYQILKSKNFDIYTVIHGDCYCFDERTNKKWIWHLPVTEGLCYNTLLKRPSPMFQSILTSKDALLEIGMLDENVPSYQEWDTSIRLGKICKFVHSKEPLFTYIFHEGPTISKNPKIDIEGYWYIVQKFKKEMLEYNVYNNHLKTLIFKSMEYQLYDKANSFLILYSANIFVKSALKFILNSEKLRTNQLLTKILKRLI